MISNYNYSTFSLLSILLLTIFAGPVFSIPTEQQPPTSLSVNVTSSGTLACGQLSVTLTATTPEAVSESVYFFSGPNSFSALNTSGVVSVSAPGTYSVVVTNATCSCQASTTTTVSSTLHPDYLPLVDLYNSTNGPGWTNKTGWLTNCDPCSGWYGVSCGESNRALSLVLLDNNLTGNLPSTLGNISQLTHIYISSSLGLTGSIPESIATLNDLEVLYLAYNRLSILNKKFINKIDNLKKLKTLELQGNRILEGELSNNIGKLTNLTWLNLEGNWIKGNIPDSIGNLKKLEYLVLAGNLFTGSIPNTLCNLDKLWVLFLDRCQLNGNIPENIGNLRSLQHLGLSRNVLSGRIPASIGSIKNITSINLEYNNLSGTIPVCLGNLTNLLHIRLDHNQLSGKIPASLTILCDNVVQINDNPNLDGDGNWNNFCDFGLGKDNSATLHPDYGALVDFYHATNGASWSNNYNWLTECNPCNNWHGVLCRKGRVINLYLHSNNLSGKIPKSINRLDSLEVIYLRNNNLTGELPKELSFIKNLSQLDLSINNIQNIDSFISEKPQRLSILELSNNKITSNLPKGVENLKSLFYLNRLVAKVINN